MEDLNTKNSNKEIERKFLVQLTKDELFDIIDEDVYGVSNVKQGYLSLDPNRTVRVRIVNDQDAILTIKGETIGISKYEFEYSIPIEDSRIMFKEMCIHPVIEKTRYFLNFKDILWEIDVFEGDNEGLIIAEVELESEDEDIDIPDWIGEEVSNDPRYFNSSLVKNPFKSETFSV